MAGGRRNRGEYSGGNVQGARVWLEVEQLRTVLWRQCIRSKGVVGGRKYRGLYDERNV